MGQRLLSITVELLADVFKGIRGGHEWCFRVVRNPLPEDAKIVSVRQSPYWPDTVEVVLESAAWDDAPPRTPIIPEMEAVRMEALAAPPRSAPN